MNPEEQTFHHALENVMQSILRHITAVPASEISATGVISASIATGSERHWPLQHPVMQLLKQCAGQDVWNPRSIPIPGRDAEFGVAFAAMPRWNRYIPDRPFVESFTIYPVHGAENLLHVSSQLLDAWQKNPAPFQQAGLTEQQREHLEQQRDAFFQSRITEEISAIRDAYQHIAAYCLTEYDAQDMPEAYRYLQQLHQAGHALTKARPHTQPTDWPEPIQSAVMDLQRHLNLLTALDAPVAEVYCEWLASHLHLSLNPQTEAHRLPAARWELYLAEEQFKSLLAKSWLESTETPEKWMAPLRHWMQEVTFPIGEVPATLTEVLPPPLHHALQHYLQTALTHLDYFGSSMRYRIQGSWQEAVKEVRGYDVGLYDAVMDLSRQEAQALQHQTQL